MRMNPDGTGLAVIGHNFRNSYEQTITSYGDVFNNDNDDPPAARTTWLMEYGNLGFSSFDGLRSWRSEKRPDQMTAQAEWRQGDPGTIPAGEKTLIVLPSRQQDMRLLEAVIEAMRERDVEVDYIFEDDLLSEALGIPKSSVAATSSRGQGGSQADFLRRLRSAEFDLGRWPRYLPDQLREEERPPQPVERGR